MKTKVLSNPAFISDEDVEALKKAILKYLLDVLYKPLIESVPAITTRNIQNSKYDALKAIRDGKIVFNQGAFKGTFTAAISSGLKSLGAKWNSKSSTWRIQAADLPAEYLKEISLAEALYSKSQAAVLASMNQVMHDIDAKSVDFTKFYEKAALKLDIEIDKQLDAITVAPQLTKAELDGISREYSKNLELSIKGFAKEQVESLRDRIQSNYYSGNRYENLIETIKKSYGVSDSKAQFLARQETKLLSMQYQEQRFTSSGSQGYIWRCVRGSPKHPVRSAHKALDGKLIAWESPPVVDVLTGRRAHAGEDFNCRCTRQIIFKFRDNSE